MLTAEAFLQLRYSKPSMRQHTQLTRWLTLVGLAGAFLAVLPLAIGAGFLHRDAPGSEATCAICHVVHMSALPGVPARIPVVLAALEWLIVAEMPIVHTPAAALNSPPRAPPA